MKRKKPFFYSKVLALTLVFISLSLKSQTDDTNFPVPNNQVYAVKYDSVSNNVFTGGYFTVFGSSARQRFAVLNATTGALSSWAASFNAPIWNFYVANGFLYVAGDFTTVNGLSRNHIAKFNIATQTLTNWNPALPNQATRGLEMINGKMYISTIGATNIFRADTATGALDTWQPPVDGYVLDLKRYGDYLYVAGGFANIDGQPRANLAAFDITTATPTLSSWAPDPDNTIYTIDAYQNSLYVGGAFTVIAGSVINNLAEISIAENGSPYLTSSWNPNPPYQIRKIKVKGNQLYYGDNASSIYEVYLPTHTNTNWLTQIAANIGYSVLGIDLSATKLFAGGGWNLTIAGATKSYFGAVCVNAYHPIIDQLSFIDAPANVCSKQTQAVAYDVDNNSGATSFNWSNNLSGVTILAPNNKDTVYINYSAVSAGTNTVSVYGTNGCVNTNTLTSTVNIYDFTSKIASQSTGFSIGSPGNITCGESDILSANDYYLGNGTITYTWSPSATLSSANTQTVSTNAKTNTLYTLTAISSDGCASIDTMTLFVNPYNLNTSVYNSNILCSTIDTLYATTNYNGLGIISFTWSPSLTVSLPHAATTAVTPLTTTDYTVTSTASDGCFANAQTISISVTPITVNAGATLSSITCGDAVQLSQTNDYPGNGVVTYTWSPATGLSNAHVDTPTAKPISFTTYTLFAKTPEGCVDTNTISIDVNPINVTASSSTGNITCGDQTQLLQSNNYNGTGTLSYSWTPSTALSSTSVSTPTANPINNTTYAITVTSSEGCQGSDYTTINVNALQINTAGSYSIACHSVVNLTTSSNSSNAGLTYSWTPSTGLSSTTAANPNTSVFNNTTYNVTMSLPNSGCQSASNSVSVNLTVPATPQICMVSVDTTGTYNIVYWDKTSYAGTSIDSFRIYRETSTNTYTQIGSVSYSSLSEFHDYGVNPNLTTYRYRLSALDSCGNESAYSDYHNTILILYSGNGQFSWNPGYTIQNNPTPVTNYYLMRDDYNTGNFQQIGNTTGNQYTLVDPNYNTYAATANWRVDADGFNCTPTLKLANGGNSTNAARVKSHSNQNNNRQIGIKQTEAKTNQVSIYPNPAYNVLNIGFASHQNKVTVKVFSVLGSEVFSQTYNQAGTNVMLDISKYESGAYLVQVTSDNISEIKRVVKQ